MLRRMWVRIPPRPFNNHHKGGERALHGSDTSQHAPPHGWLFFYKLPNPSPYAKRRAEYVMPRKSVNQLSLTTLRRKIRRLQKNLTEAHRLWREACLARCLANTHDLHIATGKATQQALDHLRTCQAEAEAFRTALRDAANHE